MEIHSFSSKDLDGKFLINIKYQNIIGQIPAEIKYPTLNHVTVKEFLDEFLIKHKEYLENENQQIRSLENTFQKSINKNLKFILR